MEERKHSWVGRLIIVQDINSLQVELEIQCNPNQNLKVVSEIDKLIVKFVHKCKSARLTRILKKKFKVGGFKLTGFRTYYTINNIVILP